MQIMMTMPDISSSLPAVSIPLPALLGFTWPLQMEFLHGWQALLLFLAFAIPITILGKRSLNGLGRVRKWVAVSIRLLVLALLVLIIGGARWQRENKVVELMVLRDMSESITNVRNFPGKTLQTSVEQYLTQVSDLKHKPADDRIGLLSFNSGATIDALPNTTLPLDAHPIRDAGRGTDVAAAIQLGLATFSKDSMRRMLLISDGNITQGDIEAATAAAAAQNVPIDVMPLRYDVKNEVLVERLVAPTVKRENERFTVDVILRSTNPPVTGKLSVKHNDVLMDLDPNTPGVQVTRIVTLKGERNVERVEVPPLDGSDRIHRFHASFEAPNVTAEIAGQTGTAAATTGPTGLAGDTLTQNNAGDAFTFVKGKGKILYVDNVPEGKGAMLREALEREQITLDAIRPEGFPRNIIDLQNYDAVILANVPRGAGGIGDDEQKMLATYVHDMGGGLVMIGGEDAFGAGGWQGSKLEEILPVNMDIPAQRQMPKGALVLIMHSCEMPDGNYWGEQCAIKAIETLSQHDEIGVISYGWGQRVGARGGGSQWDFPLGPKADGSKVIAAVKNMKLGDMPSFDDSMDLAINGVNGDGVGALLKSDAKQKHVIVISDGDPAAPQQPLINAYTQNKISVSTVSVYPHDRSDRGLPKTMQYIAEVLKGRAYGPIDTNPNQLPQIFIKEATVVRRSLIFEDKNGIPVRTNGGSTSEMIKGLPDLPSLYGMVLTSKKESPQIDLALVIGKNADPLLAHWQTGLGKAAVWTSDAYNKWAANWVASGGYEKFWAQVVRTVARPPMSSDFDITMSQVGDKGKITVEALGQDSTFLSFLSVRGNVYAPDGTSVPVRLVQTGPGVYEGEFDASQAGVYIPMMSYEGAGKSGLMPPVGLAVSTSPELRDLKSNETTLVELARKTRGRVLTAFDVESADLFNREGLLKTASPLPIWDLLIPILLATILFDVAVRRIAWDWNSTKKLALAGADYVRSFTTIRKVESKPTLDALKRVRGEVAEQKFKVEESKPMSGYDAPAPNPKAKFEAKAGVEGDISQVVGGASDKPLPAAPKKIEPKGGSGSGAGHTGSLLEAKRRAQRQIKEKEQGDQ